MRSPLKIKKLAVAAVLATCILAAIGAGTASASTVSYNDTTGIITFSGSSNDDSIAVGFSGFSYTFTTITEWGGVDAITGTGSWCNTNPQNNLEATCVVGPNAVRQLNMQMGAGQDAVQAGSLAGALLKVTAGGYVESTSAPVEAYLTDPQATVIGSPTHDYISITAPSPASSDEIFVDAGAGDDQVMISAPFGVPSVIDVTGGVGDDLIDAANSQSPVYYKSSPGQDVFIGSSQSDDIRFGDGDDWMFGGPGHDAFYDDGGSDHAKLWGGPHDDRLVNVDPTVSTPTHYEGGPGIDSANYLNGYGPVPITITLNDNIMNDGSAYDTDHVHPSVEDIGTDPNYDDRMFASNDNLTGSDGRNTIKAWAGNDIVSGQGGADALFGGNGNDTITGGAGADSITGGTGDDSIDAADGAATDTVDCGDGDDTVVANTGDAIENCEHVTLQ